MSLAINYSNGTPAPEFVSAPTTLVAVPAPAAAAPAASTTPRTQQPTGFLEKFEGAQVGMTEIKISGACSIETGSDLTVTLDDLVRAVGVYRVVKVLHYVHPKTGETVRQQVLSPVETLTVVPFDSSNPNDDGIVRARP